MLSIGNENVVRLVREKATGRNRKKSLSHRRKMARQGAMAVFVASIAVVLTALSLSHLANGIMLVTKAPAWEAWALAIGIDLGFLAFEAAQLSAATPGVLKEVSKFSKPMIIGTLAWSAVMNAFAFGAHAEGLLLPFAASFGLVIPVIIYGASRVAFTLATKRN